jgi:isoleucyl-tRNA synthetase
MSTFLPFVERCNFPAEEEKTLQFWKDIDAFQECLRQSKGKKPYNFYDGPPFATGLPHYGHILAGTIKDVVCRHAHQRGYHVERRFGWDCHGVPVEGIIDEKLKIKGRADVLEMGIDKYNEECRSIVQKYTKEWREIVERFGRWIDFDNSYKTMDLSYMESIWWVFKQLYDKGLVYNAFRVMPYSTALATSLSNFEVAQNYKEVSDPSIIVQFERTDKKDSWILAWTTTPWTLPSNLALCVHPTLTYLRVKKKEDGHEWIVGKDRFDWVCSSIKKDPKKDFELLEELPGEKLVGIQYKPLFDYFKGKVNADKVWRVVSDTYVTTGAGTCIVHQAPAFGEDDYRVSVKHGIITKGGKGIVNPVDENGCYNADVPDFKGVHVKEADKGLKAKLTKQGNMVFNGTELHNYPHCWRSDTPLIYRAIPAWFVKVEGFNDQLVKNNNQTYWVPKFVQEKRFHNWLAEARDWNVSRSRYWGAPIPLWVSEDLEEVVCIGSVAELEKYAGRKITDIHRHFIDDITIPSKKGKGVLKRVDEVFDCWFESGSMPYAAKHYPFEGKEEFEKGFPAQFIAEGLDQTRGWFYTLMVLGTHLFDKPPFQNLICNGLVLAGDGKKMSKRLKNYPDPTLMCNTYGADAVRMYMCNSPVVRAEPLKFKEEGVKEVVKEVFLPWYNATRFLVQEVTRYESEGLKFVPDPQKILKSKNIMDKWINASMHNLIKFVREEMMHTDSTRWLAA